MTEDKYVLLVHYGINFDHTRWVEMTSGRPLRTYLTEKLSDATYRDLRDAKDWAENILKNGDGTGTWKIEVLPLSVAENIKLLYGRYGTDKSQSGGGEKV